MATLIYPANTAPVVHATPTTRLVETPHEVIVDETDGKNVLETLPFELETANVIDADKTGQPTSGKTWEGPHLLFLLLGLLGVGGLGAVMASIYLFAGIYA